jgi:hypothetical protein
VRSAAVENETNQTMKSVFLHLQIHYPAGGFGVDICAFASKVLWRLNLASIGRRKKFP